MTGNMKRGTSGYFSVPFLGLDGQILIFYSIQYMYTAYVYSFVHVLYATLFLFQRNIKGREKG